MAKVRLTREEFETIIKNCEGTGNDVTELKKALAEAYPPKPVAKNPTVVVMRGEEVPIEYSEDIIECDRDHSLKELRAMAKKAGLSTGGDKKSLCTKLIAEGMIHGSKQKEDAGS